MTAGVDADFLIAVEIADHRFHAGATAVLGRLLDDGVTLAVLPQTLLEFVHVVTDPRRMPSPLSQTAALKRANRWWEAAEVVRVFTDAPSVALFFDWMREHRLGRKRLLDTLLAATFAKHGVERLVTNNGADFAPFGRLEIVPFAG